MQEEKFKRYMRKDDINENRRKILAMLEKKIEGYWQKDDSYENRKNIFAMHEENKRNDQQLEDMETALKRRIKEIYRNEQKKPHECRSVTPYLEPLMYRLEENDYDMEATKTTEKKSVNTFTKLENLKIQKSIMEEQICLLATIKRELIQDIKACEEDIAKLETHEQDKLAGKKMVKQGPNYAHFVRLKSYINVPSASSYNKISSQVIRSNPYKECPLKNTLHTATVNKVPGETLSENWTPGIKLCTYSSRSNTRHSHIQRKFDIGRKQMNVAYKRDTKKQGKNQPTCMTFSCESLSSQTSGISSEPSEHKHDTCNENDRFTTNVNRSLQLLNKNIGGVDVESEKCTVRIAEDIEKHLNIDKNMISFCQNTDEKNKDFLQNENILEHNKSDKGSGNLLKEDNSYNVKKSRAKNLARKQLSETNILIKRTIASPNLKVGESRLNKRSFRPPVQVKRQSEKSLYRKKKCASSEQLPELKMQGKKQVNQVPILKNDTQQLLRDALVKNKKLKENLTKVCENNINANNVCGVETIWKIVEGHLFLT